MNELIDVFKDQISKQGFSIFIMSFAVYYFVQKVDNLENKIDSCNQEIINLLKSDRMVK